MFDVDGRPEAPHWPGSVLTYFSCGVFTGAPYRLHLFVEMCSLMLGCNKARHCQWNQGIELAGCLSAHIAQRIELRVVSLQGRF